MLQSDYDQGIDNRCRSSSRWVRFCVRCPFVTLGCLCAVTGCVSQPATAPPPRVHLQGLSPEQEQTANDFQDMAAAMADYQNARSDEERSKAHEKLVAAMQKMSARAAATQPATSPTTAP